MSDTAGPVPHNPNAARIREINDSIRSAMWSVFAVAEPIGDEDRDALATEASAGRCMIGIQVDDSREVGPFLIGQLALRAPIGHLQVRSESSTSLIRFGSGATKAGTNSSTVAETARTS